LAVDESPTTTTSTTSTTTTTTTTTPPAVMATTTTTTTVAPPPAPQDDESGLASWYPEAPPGYCASPDLAFGTVLTVTDMKTGESIRCRVDDRGPRYAGRVVDLSYDGFADLADPAWGLIEVRLTW
jgi:rare lipoprotein A (peptidoglycan hydrolase)